VTADTRPPEGELRPEGQVPNKFVPVGGPLDDAVREYKQWAADEAARRQRDRQRDEEETEAQRRKLRSLLEDFLRRMNRAGNPGTTTDWKVGRFRKVGAWWLCYEDDFEGKQWGFLLTVDGRIPRSQYRAGTRLVPYSEYVDLLEDRKLARITRSMAELLSRNGVD
jgi:hypothetical protein